MSSAFPNTGDVAGGTQITISGLNFIATGISVTLAGAPCTNLAFNSSTQLVCSTPFSLVPRAVDVVVTNSGGQSGTAAGAFTYTGAATYTALKTHIFNLHCIGCHSGGAPSAGMDITAYADVFARTVPGSAVTSTLYKRITTQAPIMPRNAPALAADEKQAIADWINAGANNN